MSRQSEDGAVPPSRVGVTLPVGVGWNASVAYVAVLGLGISVGVAGGGSATILRVSGALLAAIALVAVAMRRPRRAAVVAVAGLVVVGAAGLSSADAGTPLYLGCFAALLAAGSELVPAVRDSLVLQSLSGLSDGLGRAATIDSLGRKELTRARRSERPLSVASVSLACASRAELAEGATRLSATLRETDLIGYSGGSRFLIVFAETEQAAARDAWSRVRRSVGHAVAERMTAGFASFPDDNPTWQGLVELAGERDPGKAAAGVRWPKALQRATASNEA
jgi:hypothetical protein